MTLKRLLPSLVVLLVSFLANGASLYSIELDNLMKAEAIKLRDYQNKMLILSVFEPECSWCLKQFKAFERLQKSCGKELQVVAVGVGHKNGLKQMVYRTDISFPAAEASPKFIELVGFPNATPFTLVIDEQGELVTSIQGYLPYAKLSFAFQDVCSNAESSL